MKKKLFLIVLVLLVVGLATSAGAWLAWNQTDNKIENGTNQGLINSVKQVFDNIEDKPINLSQNNYNSDNLVYDGNAPVYVTIYSHNEDSWEALVNTEEKYRDYRAGLVERTDLLSSYDIDWDWQTDQPVVDAMIAYEDAEDLLAVTDGKNILQYLSNNGASLDPHAHTNNYADIAYLMTKLGAEASGVIGGTIINECGKELLGFYDLDSWHDNVKIQDDGYVHGEDYPEALWQPTVLSDPGMGGHWFDNWSSGVWQPGDAEDFFVHDSNNKIVYIGEGYPHDSTIVSPEHASGAEVHNTDGQYIKELVEKISNEELPTGTKDGQKFMYTASIHVRDTDVVNDSDIPTNTVDGLKKVLDILAPLRESDKIIFADFETVAEIWQTDYNSVPWQIDLSSFSFYDEVKQQAEEYCSAKETRSTPRPPRP